MSASSGWLRARGQIAFIVGLVGASAVIISIERTRFVPVAEIIPPPALLWPAPEEAETAWAWVTRNTHPDTGLVSSEDGGDWTTVADAGHAIIATLGAYRTGQLDGQELYQRLARLLTATARWSAGDCGYRLATSSGARTATRATASAAPLRSALALVAWGYPANRDQAAAELRRWTEMPGCGGEPPAGELAGVAETLQRAALAPRGGTR